MKVYAMIANGTEEVECLAVVDVLRRAGISVALVSAEQTRDIVSSHNVKITADFTADEVELAEADALFVPGGMPGSNRLAACDKLITALKYMNSRGKLIAAICAAPAVVLGANGLLDNKRAVCFPGFEDRLSGAKLISGARVVTDGNIVTARGLGCAIELGLELVRLLAGEDKMRDIKNKIQF